MTDEKNRPEHESQDEEARREQQHEGQVSELMDAGPEAGGADATDKSTDTAPSEADQPDT